MCTGAESAHILVWAVPGDEAATIHTRVMQPLSGVPYSSASVAQGGAAIQEGLSGPDQQEENVAEQDHALRNILEDPSVGFEEDVQSKGCNHHIHTSHLMIRGEVEGGGGGGSV